MAIFVTVPFPVWGPYSRLKRIILEADGRARSLNGTDTAFHKAGMELLEWADSLSEGRHFEKIIAAREAAIRFSRPGSELEQRAVQLWKDHVQLSPERRQCEHIEYVLENIPEDTAIHNAAIHMAEELGAKKAADARRHAKAQRPPRLRHRRPSYATLEQSL